MPFLDPLETLLSGNFLLGKIKQKYTHLENSFLSTPFFFSEGGGVVSAPFFMERDKKSQTALALSFVLSTT